MIKLIFAIAGMAVSVSALANTPVINQRQNHQQNRINQGVASGNLSGTEAAQLQNGQARVANMKANAKADGKVTQAERANIKQAQNHQSQKIYNKKHN